MEKLQTVTQQGNVCRRAQRGRPRAPFCHKGWCATRMCNAVGEQTAYGTFLESVRDPGSRAVPEKGVERGFKKKKVEQAATH